MWAMRRSRKERGSNYRVGLGEASSPARGVRRGHNPEWCAILPRTRSRSTFPCDLALGLHFALSNPSNRRGGTNMASDKLPVIERIWAMLQQEGTGRRTVHFADVLEAIEFCNAADGKTRSVKNPANFMKDLIRKDKASHNWPVSLAAVKIGGRQRVGASRVFEFQDYAAGQTEPFPNEHVPKLGTVPIEVQSLSLPLASKALGRKDESWLMQVVVHLSVLEQHLARCSKGVRELVHLQTGVKLSNSEVDGLFRAIVEEEDGARSHVLVTCEAKQAGERILEHQVVDQIVAAYKSVKKSVPEEELAISAVVPIAIKAIPPDGEIYVVEFESWSPDEAEADEADMKALVPASEGLYRLVPPVPGVGYKPVKKRAKKKL